MGKYNEFYLGEPFGVPTGHLDGGVEEGVGYIGVEHRKDVLMGTESYQHNRTAHHPYGRGTE